MQTSAVLTEVVEMDIGGFREGLQESFEDAPELQPLKASSTNEDVLSHARAKLHPSR